VGINPTFSGYIFTFATLMTSRMIVSMWGLGFWKGIVSKLSEVQIQITGNNYWNSRDRLASYNEYYVRLQPKLELDRGRKRVTVQVRRTGWLRLTNVKENRRRVSSLFLYLIFVEPH
jgi:hypothetical protein